MEITAKPRRRGRRRALRVLLAAAVVAAVALLLPAALGFSTHVVGDDSMAGTHSRGALAFDQHVPMGQLVVGDVVTFVAPGGEELLTRRVVAIGDGDLQTRADAAAAVDPWRVSQADVDRVAFSVPFLGWPAVAVDSLSVPSWAPAALALGLAGLLVLVRRTSRRAGRARSQAALPERVTAAPGAPPTG